MGFLNFLNKTKQKNSGEVPSPEMDIPPPPDDFPEIGSSSAAPSGPPLPHPDLPPMPGDDLDDLDFPHPDDKMPDFPYPGGNEEQQVPPPPVNLHGDDIKPLPDEEEPVPEQREEAEQKPPVPLQPVKPPVPEKKPELPPFRKPFEKPPLPRPDAPKPHLFLHPESKPVVRDRPEFLKERDFDISGPLFIQADKYHDIIDNIECVKEEVKNAEDSLSNMNEDYSKKQEELRRYTRELEFLFKKFTQIDERIFQPGDIT